MSEDIKFYLFMAGFLIVALFLIWVKHKVNSRIIDRAVSQVAYFGAPKPQEYYELIVFVVAVLLSTILSVIDIHPVPWPLASIPFEDNFIQATHACGYGETGEEKLNAWRTGAFFALLGFVFMLFRVKSYYLECQRRLLMAPNLRAGFLFIFLLGILVYFYTNKLVEYFDPQSICTGEHHKITNILYAGAATSFSVMLIYLVSLLYVIQLTLKFRK